MNRQNTENTDHRKNTENSDRRQDAEKILRAMTDVKDEYVEEAEQYGMENEMSSSVPENPSTSEENNFDEKVSSSGNALKPSSGKTRTSGSSRKTRRIRRWTAAVIAAAACFAVLIIGSQFLRMGRASGSSSADTADETVLTGTSNDGSYAASGAGNGYGNAAADTSEETANGSNDTSTGSAEAVKSGDSTADIKKKIIYTADISIDAKDYPAVKEAVNDLVSKYDGFIESSNEYNNGSGDDSGTTPADIRSWYVTIRIPSEHFDDFVNDTGNAGGQITSKSITSSDMTKTYSDNEDRLKALRTEQESLLKLLEKAESVDDMIAIQSRLTDVRSQIASLEDENSGIDYRTSYSTVTISLNEVVSYESRTLSFGERLQNALKGGWHAFVSFLQILLVILLYVIPFAALAVVIILIVKAVRKRHGRKHR